jgi:hypothetical protein
VPLRNSLHAGFRGGTTILAGQTHARAPNKPGASIFLAFFRSWNLSIFPVRTFLLRTGTPTNLTLDPGKARQLIFDAHQTPTLVAPTIEGKPRSQKLTCGNPATSNRMQRRLFSAASLITRPFRSYPQQFERDRVTSALAWHSDVVSSWGKPRGGAGIFMVRLSGLFLNTLHVSCGASIFYRRPSPGEERNRRGFNTLALKVLKNCCATRRLSDLLSIFWLQSIRIIRIVFGFPLCR